MTTTDGTPGTPLRLRPARATDLPLLYRAELTSVLKVEPENVDAWIDTLDRTLELWTDNLERAVVAEVEGTPAGIALWRHGGSTPAHDATRTQDGDGIQDAARLQVTGRADLITLQVLGRFRGRGVAHALLDSCIRDAGAAGFTTITATVHRSNPARLLYERYGFEQLSGDAAASEMPASFDGHPGPRDDYLVLVISTDR